MLSRAHFKSIAVLFLIFLFAVASRVGYAQEPSAADSPELADVPSVEAPGADDVSYADDTSDAVDTADAEADDTADADTSEADALNAYDMPGVPTEARADEAPCDDCACTPERTCSNCNRCGIVGNKARLHGVPPYKPLFYDNDFSYLCKPSYNQWWPGDSLKMRGLGRNISYDVGGQYRARFHSERNMRGLGLTGVDDQFLLHRTRIFTNVRFGKRIRFYAEYIDAVSNYENFKPRPIEENRSDMLNLFVDALLIDGNRGQLSARVGRQEVLYGAERAVSPLDWANTRRTFDGVKLLWQGKNWDIDGFWLRPMRRSVHQFDNPNLDMQFYGIYSSYKGFENDKLEAYWLAFDNDVTGARVDSLGGRYYGCADDWLVELWGNYQFGTNADNSSHSAAAMTCGLGRKLKGPWKSTLWFYYDYASGDNELGTGNGYFQFFPLAHKYMGFMDLFGRRNIETPNIQLAMHPTDKLTLLAWYYYFMLEDDRDTPYNVNMSAFAPGITPDSSHLGQEIDLAAMYKMTPRTSLLFGYSHFFAGDYYSTPGLPYDGSADFFYTHYQIDF